MALNEKELRNLITVEERTEIESAADEFRKEFGTANLDEMIENILTEIDEAVSEDVEFTSKEEEEIRQIQSGQASVGSITCKVAYKLLKKYRKKS